MIDYINLKMMAAKLNSVSGNSSWLNFINGLKKKPKDRSSNKAGFAKWLGLTWSPSHGRSGSRAKRSVDP